MKTTGFIVAVSLATGLQMQAQRNPEGTRVRAEGGPYSIVEIGHHHRVWSRVIQRTNEFGQVVSKTNSFTELSTGLHRLVNGRWVESTPELVITNNGVIGRGAGHELHLAANLNTRSAVQVRLPSGEWLKSSIIGLAYHDVASGTNVLIAELKDSTAQVIGSNQTHVVFVDAFTDFKADVSYEYRKSGVAQLVTLRERPPAPEVYGLSSASTHLLILSEFTEAPTPQVKERFWRSGRDTLRDDALDFGPMRMGRGRAFGEGNSRNQFNLPISKQWELLSGRRVLVERVSYVQTREELLRLPPASSGITNAGVSKPSRWFANGELPASKTFSAVPAQPMQQMAALKPRDGFVLDWELIYSGTAYEFYCDNTYVVSGECHFLSAWFESGSFLKYRSGSSLYIDGPVGFAGYECIGMSYTLLTPVNDDANGEWIPESTGSPEYGDYGPALVVRPEDLAAAQTYVYDLYGYPGIVASPPSLSTVTVSASDPTAIKGGDPAAFTITRVNGDWDQALTVQFTVGGTAVPGSDYQSLGTSATIQANQPSVIVSVNPLSAGGGLCDSTVSLTIQPNTAYQVGSPAGATVVIYDPSVSPQPVATPSGLVAWWQAEGNAIDTVSGAVATLWNGASIIQGKVGQTFRFDGVNDHVRIADRPELRLTGPMAIEYWVFPTTRGSWYNNMVTKWDAFGTQNQRSYGVGCYPDGRVYFVITATGTDAGSHSALSPAAIPLNQWTHVAVTYDGATIRLYFNGVLQAQAAHTTGVFPGTGDLAIGGAVGGAAPGQMVSPFPGWIDEVSIYNRGLSEAEIQTIYNASCGGKKPTLSVTANDPYASEPGVATGQFTITRTGPTGAGLIVQFQMQGTALNGTDYTTISSPQTIPPGSASKTITLTPLNVPDYQGTRSATLSLVDDPAYLVGTRTATVTIVDDDSPAGIHPSTAHPVVTLTTTDSDAREDTTQTATVRNGTFLVTRSDDPNDANDLKQPVLVKFHIGGTATYGVDYDPLADSTSATIPANQTSATIVIAPKDDAVVEAAETVVVTVQPNVGYDVGSPFSASITIDDKTNPSTNPELITYTVKATDFVAIESATSGGYADPGTFTITRTGSILSAKTINYTSPNGGLTYSYSGTAILGNDYGVTAPPIAFGAGAATCSDTVSPLWQAGNPHETSTETVILTVDNAGIPNSDTVFLYDSHDPSPSLLSVSVSQPLVTEGSSRTITFTRSASADVRSAFFRLDGQANPVTDYTLNAPDPNTFLLTMSPRLMQISFKAGSSTVSVNLTAINDSTTEGVESVIVTIAPPTSPLWHYQIGSPRQAALRIRDSASVTDYVPDTDHDGIDDVAEVSGSPPTDPLMWDTDGDGLPDGNISNQSVDTDGDGVSNASEGALGILKTDSDGDGISDFKELLLGLDPSVANTILDTQPPVISVSSPTSPKVTQLP